MTSEEYEKSSRLWYLAPIFLGIIGGLVAYLMLKKINPKLAKRCLIVGILIIMIPIIIGISLVLYGTMFAGPDYDDPNRVVDVLWDAFSTNNTDHSSINAYTEYETPEELFNRFQTIMDELDRISRISDEMVVIDYQNDEISDLQNQTDILIFNDITKQKLLSILESAKLNSQISEMKALSITEDEANENIAQTEFFIENYIDELNAIMDISSEDVEILLTKAKQISTDSKKRDMEIIELISDNSLFFTGKLIDQMKEYVDETRLITQKMRDLGFDVTISAEHEDHVTGIMETASRTMPNTKTFENPQQ